MNENELSQYISSHDLKPFTANSLSEEKLVSELETIRKQGWAIDQEEHEENIICIAAPVRDYSGKAVAAISVSWPVVRFERQKLEENAELIRKTACDISSILGYEN